MEFIAFFKIILPVICSAAFFFLPRTFKNDRIFGIQLAQSQNESIRIKNIVRLYELLTCICAVILAGANLFCILRLDSVLSDLCLTIILFITVIVQAALYSLGSHLTRRCAKKYLPMPESTTPASAEPIDTRISEGSYCPPMWFYGVHAIFILLGIYIICSSYGEISSYLPLWCDFGGVGMFYVQKSYPVLFLPVILQMLFTLLGIKISSQIKNAPLDLAKVTTASALEKSRKRRTEKFLYVYMLTALFCAMSCVYIFCVYIVPAYRLFAVYFAYAMLLAIIVSLPWVLRKE